MQIEVDFFGGIRKLLTHHNIVSISGESGTGKTTLAIQLVGTLLTYEVPFTDSCIWVQASELLSLKRLTQVFQEQNKKLEYVQNNIYVIPQERPVHTYEQQSSIIQQIIGPTAIIPPSLKFIVIDNISHHLRYKLTQYHSPKDITSLLDTFYETQLMPVILFCKRNDIILILIHEVTFSPKYQCNRPFFYKLYDRIRTIDIVLSKVNNSEKKNLHIFLDTLKWNFQFILKQKGITLI